MKNLIRKTVVLVGLMSLVIYAADDVKIKLTDTAGTSNFAVQDSTPTTVFQVDSDGNAKLLSNAELRLYNAGNTFYTGFKAPVLGSNLMLTLPGDSGSDGYVLKTNGAGVLSWVDKENPLTFNLPLSRTTNTITILPASGSQNGYLASADWTTFTNHAGSTSNPHSVTKTQIGLGNVADSLQLVASNNLSDLTNAATARTNIGLGSVENTALTTWAGSSNITTVGAIGAGIWRGTAITKTYIAKGYALDTNNLSLHDVLSGTPTTNYIPKWDGTNWIWAADAGATSVSTSRLINTAFPLSGGGDLSADRTIAISLASTTVSGYLSTTDWNTFNNKQAALGFTPENSANKNVNSGYAGLNASGLLDVTRGGTGAGTFTAGYLKGSGTTAFSTVATIPNTDITGLGTMSVINSPVPLVNGGTGVAAATAIAAFNALAPTTTKGDIIVYNNAANNIRLPVGSDNQVLEADSTVAEGVKWTKTFVYNQSVAAQAPAAATDTYLVGSSTAIPANSLQIGTRYHLIFDVSKTAAGTAAPLVYVRFGTLGTTGDTARLTFTFTSLQTAAADIGTFEIWATFRAVGVGTAVMQGTIQLRHRLAATGLGVLPQTLQFTTPVAFDSTVANSIIGVSVNSGAAAAWTIQLVQAELTNLD